MRDWINIVVGEVSGQFLNGTAVCKINEGNDFLTVVIEKRLYDYMKNEVVNEIYLEETRIFKSGPTDRWVCAKNAPNYNFDLYPEYDEYFGISEGTKLGWQVRPNGIIKFYKM